MGSGFAGNQFDQPALLEEASWSNRKGAGQQSPSLSLLPPSQQLLLLPTRNQPKARGQGHPRDAAGGAESRDKWRTSRPGQLQVGGLPPTFGRFVERAWRPWSDCPCFTPAVHGGGEGVADGPPRTAEKLK